MIGKFFLRNYDLAEPVLIYDPDEKSIEFSSREEAMAKGIPRRIGAYVSEGGEIFGVFGSPAGPVLFRNKDLLLAVEGVTVAKVQRDEQLKINHYLVSHAGKPVFGVDYKEREGLYVNPYDKEVEDIDLFVMISSGLRKHQFYKNYTIPI